MAKFNHAITLCFSVVSETEDGSDITPEMLRDALKERIAQLNRGQEWEEACLPPFDTYRDED